MGHRLVQLNPARCYSLAGRSIVDQPKPWQLTGVEVSSQGNGNADAQGHSAMLVPNPNAPVAAERGRDANYIPQFGISLTVWRTGFMLDPF